MPAEPRQPLSRATILDAALRLADERGLAAVSMRAVAELVGVTPMALYPHVGSKDALLDGLVDRMLAEQLPTAADFDRMPWRERLSGVGRAVRDLSRRHPAVFTLLFERPAVTADAVRVVDLIYRTLLDAGVPASEVPRLERLFTTFCMGYALSEVYGRFGEGSIDPRGRRAGAAPGTVPAHELLAPILDGPVDWTAEYEADLAQLIELVGGTAAG